MKTFIFIAATIACFCYVSGMEIQTNPFRIHFNGLEKGIGIFMILIGVSLIIDYSYTLGASHKQVEMIDIIEAQIKKSNEAIKGSGSSDTISIKETDLHNDSIN